MAQHLDSVQNPQWRSTIGVLFATQFFSGMAFSFVLPFFPFYFRNLGVTDQDANLMWNSFSALAFGITMTVSAPLWGMFADRWGRKLMLIRSLFAGSVILGLMGFATQPWHLLVLRMLQGATTGTVTASVTLASSITPEANRGTSLGLIQTAILLGSATGPIIGGIMAGRYGFRLPCILSSVLMAVGTILVILFAREQFSREEAANHRGFRTLRDIINTRGFKFILSIFFLVYVLNNMLFPVLPLFIEQLNDTGVGAESLTGLIVGVTLFLAGISAVWFGRLGDRFGYGRVMIYSLVASGIVALPQAFASSVMMLFVERCLFGLAIGGLIPSVNALVSSMIPSDRIGSAYGLTSAVTCFGIGMGPFIGGVVGSAMGLRVPFLLTGILSLALAVYSWHMFRRESEPAPAHSSADVETG